jgi:predicted NAD-dependent protein-ADP-ribosyltransferase YbiA (DUF1768 family)
MYPSQEHFYMMERCRYYSDKASLYEMKNCKCPCNDIMLEDLCMKFRSHPSLWDVLKSTQGCILAESSPTDYYFGIGLTYTDTMKMPPRLWPGCNVMGKLLVHVREELLMEGY